MRVVGYLRGPVPDGMDCERPLSVVMSRDGEPFVAVEPWLCQNHRRSKCGPCAARYARRVKALAIEGMYVKGGFYGWFTLTAPGDGIHCKKRDCARSDCAHEKCLCTWAEGVDLGHWNPGAGKLWNRFMTALTEACGERIKYFRAVEVQERGAIHYHVLFRSDVVISEKTLRELAIANGFGHSIDLQELAPGSKNAASAAHYVAKYVTKSCDDRDNLPWLKDMVDPETYEVTEQNVSATFRTWSQSKNWGLTMAALRDVARRRWESRQAAHQALASEPLLCGASGDSQCLADLPPGDPVGSHLPD